MNLPSLSRWWGKREVPVRHPGDLPADPFQALHREMTRVFDDFWRGLERTPFGLPGLGLTSGFEETDAGLEARFELPGFEEKDLDVSIGSGLLTVKAERKQNGDGRSSHALVRRTVSLPPGVDGDDAAASYKNGVLTVTVPKTALPASEVKRISVTRA